MLNEIKKMNIPMTESLEQVFNIEPLDLDCWTVFSISNGLKELNYTKNSSDCISITYNFKGDDNLYFIKMLELENVLEMINDSGVKYKFKEIDNQIFIFFN